LPKLMNYCSWDKKLMPIQQCNGVSVLP
jgi:hypothetical protein